MKGRKKMPKCDYSNYVVKVLHFYGLKNFKDVNVLSDDTLFEAVKTFSDWPTFPQLYVKGEFIGGYDIVKEMHSDGSLEELFMDAKLISGPPI